MGKAKEKLISIRASLGAAAQGEVRVEWKPDFAINDVDSGGTIAQILPGGGPRV